MEGDLIIGIRWNTSNDIAIAWGVWIVVCSKHYSERGTTIPFQFNFI